MRILHMTDVHFLQAPPIKGMLGKRALGMANHYIAGRKSHVDATTLVGLAVEDALQWDADLFVFTGDLTALALDSEFAQGVRAFSPLLESMPSIMIPGNHDTYTREASRTARMEEYLGRWMAGGRARHAHTSRRVARQWHVVARQWHVVLEGDELVSARCPTARARQCEGRFEEGFGAGLLAGL